MPKSLIIVESPAKAKTITKYLGDKFIVSSSYGHIRDLPKNDSAIDIKNHFKPHYIVSEDKEKVVRELKKLTKDVDDVYLATDGDREGEAISWHLCEVLGLDPKTAKRITYTEITEKAIKAAINKPRLIDLDLVNAQQARRVLDRLVGFEISPILWRKVKPNLSAGRVQSVAVRLIVDREREIMAFNSSSSFKLTADFEVKDYEGKPASLKAEYTKEIADNTGAMKILEALNGAHFSIKNVEKKPGKKSPSAPFTTSTLQQEASRKLGFSVSKTMVVAQNLYEAGHITYMRTDSVSLSDTALQEIEAKINQKYGAKYHKQRKYATKSANAQEAHEAIRPSSANQDAINASSDEQRLYDLIWKRTIASQMEDAALERTIVDIQNDKNDIILIAKGEVVTFDGFLKVYNESKDEDDSEEKLELLPPLKVGEALPCREIEAVEKFSKHAARYNEASLVRKLEELGIGRPSTYAPTITTIQKRTYVLKDSRDGVDKIYQILKLKNGKIEQSKGKFVSGAEKNKLFPTDTGILVNDFLVKNFKNIVDFKFTAKVEEEFDHIANGNLEWTKMMDLFYKPFHKEVEETLLTAERVTGERPLGNHPETGEPIIARMGRFGPMVQIGVTDENKPDVKPRYAKLKKEQNIENITLEQALELFKLPRVVGEFEGKEMKVSIGRFGPYIQHDSKFVSLKKEDDPYTVTDTRCVELIEEKRIAEANKHIMSFEPEEIYVLNGRWGPYIQRGKGKDFYKIPKTVDATKLTLQDCLELIDKQGGNEKGRKAAAAAKEPAKKTASAKKTKVAKKTTTAKKTTAAKKEAPIRTAASAKKTVAKKKK